MQKGDPDWSHTESGAEAGNGSETPVPVKKATPQWAQTVPTSPGDPVDEAAVTEAPITEPPKAIASDAVKSTWPPASETAPAPPEETDIWPPEPPTEHAMPAWRPPSELEDEPAIPAQAIPSWADSFDAVADVPTHEPAPPALVTPDPIPPANMEAPQDEPASSHEAAQIPAAAAPSPAAPAPTPEPPPAADEEPVHPSQPGPISRPSWAPAMPSQPAAAQPDADRRTPVSVPSWAPKISPPAEPTTSHPGTPTWFSPKEEVRHSTPAALTPPAPAPAPAPLPPVSGGQLPVAPIPVAPVTQATPAAPAQQPAASKASWEVVPQTPKSGPHAKVQHPTAEDRSYAEWFAWAKRGGAPASACHAAAQGAFAALTSGKDVATAVQWATAAMSRPPANVDYDRQTYCAWFALANIDLNLDQQRAHAFATGALAALDAGQDPSGAHAAGLAAAGIK